MENQKYIHIFFVIHGMGEASDIPLRPIEDCANSFKNISKRLLKPKFSTEYIPITWYDAIHIDKKKWKDLTLSSLKKFRLFTNTAFSDIIYYSNYEYRKLIINLVIEKLNKEYAVFMKKNNSYNYQFSIIGHSLGSLIVYDILSNKEYYEKLNLKIDNFFAIGSPISFFLTTRGVNADEENIQINCNHFYNIFNPLDPFAYRMEPFIKKGNIQDPILIKKAPLTNDNQCTSDDSFNYQDICYKNGSCAKNKNKRVDFTFEKSTWNTFDYFYCLKAHSSYWDLEELVIFFIQQINSCQSDNECFFI